MCIRDSLRAARPDIALSTDIIVGFPTESDSDFAATMNVVHEAAFDHAFSFNYSPRPGTPAANLADTVPAEEKSKRLQILQTRVRQQGMRYAESLVGTTQQVLVERASVKSPNQMAGRAGNNRWVNFDGDRSLIGQMVDVVITEALPNSLRGRLVNASVAA